jgi:hypothetical protein
MKVPVVEDKAPCKTSKMGRKMGGDRCRLTAVDGDGITAPYVFGVDVCESHILDNDIV